MKLLEKLTGWWRGKQDPAAEAESNRLQEERETLRGSAGAPGWTGVASTHGHESDYRDE